MLSLSDSESDVSSVCSEEDSLFTSDGSWDKFVFAYDTANDHVEKLSATEARLYELDIRGIGERGRALGTELHGILKASEDISKIANDQLGGLSAEAESISKFEPQVEVQIGFLGDQGSGKP